MIQVRTTPRTGTMYCFISGAHTIKIDETEIVDFMMAVIDKMTMQDEAEFVRRYKAFADAREALRLAKVSQMREVQDVRLNSPA